MVQQDRRPTAALPADLDAAIREWQMVAAAVVASGGPAEQDLVRRRGRALATRAAAVLGRPVDFVDPVTGVVESITAAAPAAAAPRPRATYASSGSVTTTMPRLDRVAPGPTPWATGLTISAFFAVFVALADVALSSAFADAFGLLWVPANLLIGLGLAPSLVMLRATPFWRWPAFGVAAGLVAAWVVLLLSLLG